MQSPQRESSKSIIDEKDLKFLWRTIRKNWLIVATFAVIAFIFSYFYTYKLVDIYAARTQILLKNKETGYQDQINQGIGFNWWNAYYEDYSDELNIVKSYDLVLKAVERLHLDVSYFIVGRLKTIEVYEAVPYQIKLKNVNPLLYEVPISLRIIDKNSFKLTYEINGISTDKVYHFNEEIVDNNYSLIVENKGIDDNNFKKLGEINYVAKFHSKESLVYRFQSVISANVADNTAIMELTVEDEVQTRAVMFLDTLSKIYIENTLQTKIDINNNTLKYIDNQLGEVTDVLTTIENDLEAYKKDKSILDLPKEEADFFTKLSEFESQSTTLRLKLSTLEALEKYIIENKDPVLLPPSSYVLSDDGFLTKSVNELYNMQIARTNALFTSTDKSMTIDEFDQRMDRLKNNLLTYIINNKKAINNTINRINNQIGSYESSIKTIPKKQRDLLNIQRKLQVNEKMYLFLLEKKANTIITKAGIIPETKIVEHARGMGVVKPDKQKIITSHISIAVVLAFVLIFIRTLFFDRIESLDELKNITNKPLLAEIINTKESATSYLVVESSPKSAITESFRLLRTNLEYLTDFQNKSKVILITSENPGEGKTFCSLNLAVIIAKAGKKVLILELDLHKPKVQIGLDMKSEKGLSNYLSGQTDKEEIILPTSVENLDTILSGPIPPNASELILSERMASLIEYSKLHYDYVIIDTPPVSMISDAIVLMRYSDANLFVVNANYPNKKSVKNALALTESNNIQKLAFVLNGVKKQQSKYYYNAYGYGYSYGYGSNDYGNLGKNKNGIVKVIKTYLKKIFG